MESNQTYRVEENGQNIHNREEFKEEFSKKSNQKGILTDNESNESIFAIAEESS